MSKQRSTPNLRAYETPATKAHCPRCRALLISAWVDGGQTYTDPYALTIQGQIKALEQTKTLYQLSLKKGTTQTYLYFFTRWDILAGKQNQCVLAEHKCGQVITGMSEPNWQQQIINWLQPPQKKSAKKINNRPPF